MNRKTSSVFCSIIVIAFGVVLNGQSNGDENSRALKCFEIKVTAADEKDRPAVNTVNGSGLVDDLCDDRWENTWVTTSNDNNAITPHSGTARGATWIKFEFDKVYNLKEMWVWNYNEEINRGLKNVAIDYTVDGRTWEKLGDYVFAQAPGTVSYAHNTTVDFNGVAAKAVVITAREGRNVGNYGNSHRMYGLSEVRFYVAKESGCKDVSLHNSAKFTAPPAKLRLRLERGITVDRQVRSIPPQPFTTVSREDIQLIKSMGFEFVKRIINPAVFKSEGGLKSSSMLYFDQIVNMVVDERLPVVVCIHPEGDFKSQYLGSKTQFESLLGFYENLAIYMAQRWNPDQLAFQIMTEPFGTSSNPEDWNYWNNLQHRIWKVVRQKMPGYTLILSGDMAGKIEGVYDITPVDDENIMYSFTFYEPHLFTFQGGQWQPGGIPYLKNLPYPSGPEILKSMPDFLSSVPEQWKTGLKSEIERYANEHWNRERLKARIERLVDWNRYYGGGLLKIWCAEFGCYQGGVNPADRSKYIEDLRTIFEANKIGWAYWSYNETFSVMTSDRIPMGAAGEQTPDKEILRALLPDKHKSKKEGQ
jgi:endoglucanase